MDYIGVYFHFNSGKNQNELLIAYLAELEYESFEEKDDGVVAYMPKKLFDENRIKNLLETKLSSMDIWYNYETINDQNWNELWESNYQPVTIANQCLVRAPFHKSNPDIKYEIIIEPQMSFGTAHHETTVMMLEYILEHDFKGSTVLDMGCGTAVLAILAAMKEAGKIEGIDLDEWAYRNSLENVKRNGFPNINIIQGDSKKLKGKEFSVIFANINRNILLQDMSVYAEVLTENGRIYFSGFYQEDLKMITDKANGVGLKYINHKLENRWVAAYFQKNDSIS
jgi:ribosomal protein L11 methyltransferase